MNTKLFSKVSTILASVLVLAACGPTGQPSESESTAPTYATTQISAATAWDYDSQSPVLDGQLVRFEDAVITAQYGARNISVAQYNVISDSEVDIYAIEVLLAADLEGFDIKDIVTVSGTITSTNGRVQLGDATIEWGTDGQEACDGAGSLWYSRINEGRGRSWWDTVVRTDACQWYEFQAQFASVPTFTAGQETTFYIVFPGENPELDFETNYSLVDVHVPALSEEQATALNTWAAQFEVGDFVLLFSQVWFNNYSCLMLPYTAFRFEGTNEPTEVDGLYTSWDDACAAIQALYDIALPAWGNSNVISWVVNLRYYTDEESGLPWSIVTANVKNGEEAFVDYFVEGVAAYEYADYGWTLQGPYQSEDGDIFVDLLYNVMGEGEEATYDFVIEVVLGETTLEFYFIPVAEYTVIASEGASLEGLVAAINANFAAKGYSFGLEWDETYQEYSLAISFGEATEVTENNLYQAAATLASFVPMDGLSLTANFYDDPASEDFIDILGAGIASYFIQFVSGEGVVVSIVAYVYSGKLIAQMSVYQAS